MSYMEHRHLLSGWRFKALIATLILSVIGYFFCTLWGGWRAVVDASIKVGIVGILMALGLALVNYGLRFIRWQHYLSILGHSLPWLTHLRIYLSGFALTTTPGKAGEALRSVFLKDYHVPYRQSFGAFLSERFSDLLSVCILTGIGLWFMPEWRGLVLVAACCIAVGLIILQSDAWMHRLESYCKRLFAGRFGHTVEFGIETVLAFRSCFSWPALLYGVILGVAAWAAEGLAFYYVLKFMGVEISLLTAIYIYCFGALVGALTFLPGGLGGTEVAMIQLLLLQNVSAADAVAATLVIRITTLWFSVFLGLSLLPFKELFLTKK